MSGICSVCGKKEMLPYKCKFCGWTYCSEHRLPENHECTGLDILKKQTRDSGRIVYNPESEPVNKQKMGILGLSRRDKSPYAIPVSRNYSLYIMIACVVVYLLQLIFWPEFNNYFMLTPSEVTSKPWTIFTYMFLHSKYRVFHIVVNMMVLFFFGPILERKIGSHRFLTVYFGAGLISAIGHMVFSGSPVLGASGAIYGIFACLAVLEPEIRVYFYFIPMKITQALVLFAAINILFMGSNDMIAHAAHLSGLVFGLFMGLKLKKSVSKSAW